GVFGSLQEAEQAVQALVDAGYHVEDMALIPGQDFPSAFQERLRKEGRFLRIMHHLQVTTDEGSLRELLEASARQGSAIILLYVPQREHIDEVSALLFNHSARLVEYVGKWSVEDLFPPIKEKNVSAKATTGLGYKPESNDQQPGEALQQSDSTRSQDWGREQAGQVPGQQSGPTTGDDFDPVSGVTDDDGGMTQEEEQEGEEVNIEQSHQTTTAQYTGKPGVKAPSFGKDPGSAASGW
ncbi:MAG TPA: hypothetical protein VJQ26_10440, partial [Ktedonobacteraceae bacterium]|nr:hypothetical protein [Ktedonobacteraceae bacterium]